MGAGAAGLVAAIFASANGADVLVIESTADGGRKILISGGGRCNILPSVLRPERFVTASPPHLMRNMLKAWPLHEQRAFFENDVGIPLALEEESGKLFPASNKAREVRDGLIALAKSKGVRFQFQTKVSDLTKEGAGWQVQTTAGPVAASRVILATGGLSVPTTGSEGAGLRVADQLGHRLIATYPALTPLLADKNLHASLSGVSLDVDCAVSARARSKSRRVLFTHRGYNSPSSSTSRTS